ncbi:MAG: tetratricopeptide repeat protein, partial [Halieaceae bacterium]|nr:tetratricopeptide repeat protein [Halieaceae bacterium]
VAASLASVPLDQISPEQVNALQTLFTEYQDTLAMDADMPGVQIQLGIFHVARGNEAAAEAAYREALYLNPQLIPAYLNLADLLRSRNKDNEARILLRQALSVDAQNGPVLHSLGLLETRSGQPELALDYLRQAAELEASGTRHRFVYSIALHDLGDPTQALEQLKSLLRSTPENVDVLLALANYSNEQGLREEALGYARTLTRIAPGNRNYQQLYKQLSGAGPSSP